MGQKRPPKRRRQSDGDARNSRENGIQRSVSLTATPDRLTHIQQSCGVNHIQQGSGVNHIQQGSGVSTSHVGRANPEVQSAKSFAIQQAQKDGCTGSFKSFDSQFGNFLVPVIPSLSDLMMLEKNAC